MSKHAYLIMAHNQFDFLEMLLHDLDYEDNDIYLHVDKKAAEFDEEYFCSITKKSNLHIIPRLNIHWAGYSIVNCILTLLEHAVAKGGYRYYHLLTGSEFPIQSQEKTHAFFDENYGKEFIGFDNVSNNFLNRVKYYHIFNERGRDNSFRGNLKAEADCRFMLLQEKLHFDRTSVFNQGVVYKKGNMTWSITDKLARYIVKQNKEIRKFYAHTWCCDEVFVQTIVFNSEFYNNVYDKDDEYHSQMRMCQWDRPDNQYHIEDIDNLVASERFFARKLCGEEGKEIAKMLVERRND